MSWAAVALRPRRGTRILVPGMFALYYEQEDGRLTWIASCQEVRSARNIAQVYSTGTARPVVCIYNGHDGTTRRWCVYRDGSETEGHRSATAAQPRAKPVPSKH
jgi:hypothetical protein